MADQRYRAQQPAADAVAATRGLLLLDFGTDWCGHCQAGQAAVRDWTAQHPQVEHLRIEDGRGRPLGRAYRVKLWPTLVLLRDGEEIARAVRPREPRDLWGLDQALG